MLLLGASVMAAPVRAAEIRGQVEWLDHDRPVSVALLPLDGQRLPAPQPKEHLIRLQQRQFAPVYVLAGTGDRVRFVNQDDVYHILTAPYGPQPLQATLGKSGDAASTSIVLTQPGTLRVFCRLHAGSYAQIDVLDTPLSRLVDADGSFEFQNVPPGRWRLRVAALGAEPVYREITAFTAPPPVHIPLPSAPRANPAGTSESVQALFPVSEAQP